MSLRSARHVLALCLFPCTIDTPCHRCSASQTGPEVPKGRFLSFDTFRTLLYTMSPRWTPPGTVADVCRCFAADSHSSTYMTKIIGSARSGARHKATKHVAHSCTRALPCGVPGPSEADDGILLCLGCRLHLRCAVPLLRKLRPRAAGHCCLCMSTYTPIRIYLYPYSYTYKHKHTFRHKDTHSYTYACTYICIA